MDHTHEVTGSSPVSPIRSFVEAHVTPRLAEIERKAIRLPAKDRELLAERLIQSLDNAPLTEVDEAWVKEAERRFSAYRRGQRQGVPAGRAFRQIRMDLGL